MRPTKDECVTSDDTAALIAHLDDWIEEVRPVRMWIRDFSTAEVRRLQRVIELVESEKQDVLPLFISSMGGNLWNMMAMFDLIASCSKPVATIALGCAMSAGCDLLAAGTKGYRYIGLQTIVMVHDSVDEVWGKNADVQAMAREAQRARDLSFDLFARHTGKTKAFWDDFLAKRLNVDVYLPAQKAVRLGIADHVGVPSIAALMERGADPAKKPSRV